MVECAFGIQSNKRRIFHRAIDIRQGFCSITVKTCCILQLFFLKKEGFQFQDTLFECPRQSTQAVGTRSNIT
jgi:hypothetical protein